jgi:methionine biosynthesis protein MetW
MKADTHLTDRSSMRTDLRVVADMVAPGSRVLDIGCGDGALLEFLSRFQQVDGRGIELSTAGVNACISAGLSVIQGDADTDLMEYPDNAFDYAILTQTLQATRAPREVLQHLMRIGERAIISFPNFGYWRIRLSLMTHGRMPRTGVLPDEWYTTQNIHFCTIKDFVALADEMGIKIERQVVLDHTGSPRPIQPGTGRGNLSGEVAIFLLSRS